MNVLSLDFVASFGERDLYVAERYNWTLKFGAQFFDTSALKNRTTLSWLPLLEQDYANFQASLVTGLSHVGPNESAKRLAAFPVQDLILLGLASGSGYWIELALQWVGKVGIWPELLPILRSLSLDSSFQPIRHRAKRLYYTGKL
ncbi:hypothetical protein ACVWYF_003039 [Hymenobacter sp. UYAg731]